MKPGTCDSNKRQSSALSYLLHSHWQLRSLISCPERNHVYYPIGTSIYVLNTRTGERQLVTTLSFYPRCLAVDGGWLCCGGDGGQYAALDIRNAIRPTFSLNLDTDPDARLPLDLEPTQRSITRDTASYLLRFRNRYPLIANEIKVGTEIVNCVTLWFPNDLTSDRTYKKPVAVAANNDRSVSILSLEDDSEVVDKLTFPDFVNRSVISPDGEILATICDDPFLYIHQRRQKADSVKEGVDSTKGYDWGQWSKIQLASQRQADKSSMRGSFAASFSKSGKYLAVATQYGMISVFDAEQLTKDEVEPLVIFTSSRPGREFGAVRDMVFSPEPYDLLAWTESNGRIAVADVRNMFLSRQLIMIDTRNVGVERVPVWPVSEQLSDPTIDPRLRNVRTESPSSSSTTPDYLGMDYDRRNLRHITREMLDRHQSPLTPEELDVLTATRLARRQRVEASLASRWGSILRSQLPAATTNGEGSSSNDRRTSTAGYPAALRDFIHPERSATASFRSFMNERDQERERRLQAHEPRRRSSIILAATEQSIERETLGLRSTRNNHEADPSLSPYIRTPRRLIEPPGNPWVETDLYLSTSSTEAAPERSARLRVELEEEERSDFAQRLRQPWRPIDDANQSGLGALEDSEPLRGTRHVGPLETMGCSWSPDGRIL